MAMVNIPSTCDDPQYRYKMPRLVTKKEGRGNGSKTCIVNMTDVARALKRPPQYTTKWFGSELGAQSTYTNKEGEGERAIVNGHHDTPIFQTMLDKFIDKYVLCDNCKLPEIDMIVKKGNIQAKCKACGWAGDLDNNHKLAAFILKNPPDEGGWGCTNLATAAGKDDTKKDKDARRKEREEKRKAKAEAGEAGEDEEDDAEVKVKKEKKEKKERSGEKKEKKEKTRDLDDGEEGVKKEKKERKEKKEKKEGREGKEKKEKKEKKAKEEVKEEDSDKDSEDDKKEEDIEYDGEIVQATIKIMRELVTTKPKVSPDDYFEELRMQQLSKLFDHKIRFYIALESLMPDGSMDAKSCAEQKGRIEKVLAAVKIPANDILWGFDAYLAKNEKAVKGYPMVLKVIYDEEWASEEELFKHYRDEEGGADEPGFAAAKKSGAPFLKWLETAAESSDEEEESSEED